MAQQHAEQDANDPASFAPLGEESLVAIWQKIEGSAGEDLYILSMDFYERRWRRECVCPDRTDRSTG